MPARPDRRGTVAAVTAVCLALSLAACAPDAPTAPTPTSSGPSSAPTPLPIQTPTPTPTPEPPRLHPDGTAADNLPFFQQTLDDYVSTHGRGERAILIGHIRAAGFPSDRIEAGWATTPKGLWEVSIETAVRFGDQCVMGTVRAERATAVVMPVLSTGHCLIGRGFRDSP